MAQGAGLGYPASSDTWLPPAPSRRPTPGAESAGTPSSRHRVLGAEAGCCDGISHQVLSPNAALELGGYLNLLLAILESHIGLKGTTMQRQQGFLEI